MQQRRGKKGAGSVLPLLRHAGHSSPPLGCDYRAYGAPADLRWNAIRLRLESEGEQLAALMAWIDGAMTGLNIALHDTFDISPYGSEDILPLLVLELCEANPEWPLHAAVLELGRILAPFRARTDGGSVLLTAGESRMRVRQSALRLIQSALALRGFLTQTEIGGRRGDLLRSALLAFQTSEDLPLSGLPDPRTLTRLMQPPR